MKAFRHFMKAVSLGLLSTIMFSKTKFEKKKEVGGEVNKNEH